MNSARVGMVALVLAAAGCSTLQPVREPAQFIPAMHPKVVFVTYKNRSIIEVAQPRMSGDTIHGTLQGHSTPIAVPLRQIQSIAALQHNKKRTIIMIAGLSVLTAATIYGIAGSWSGKAQECDYKRWPPTCSN
jgi:hypothetical protein